LLAIEFSFAEAKTENKLWDDYTSFGEDPFIRACHGVPEYKFKAWDYAKMVIARTVDEGMVEPGDGIEKDHDY